MKGNNSPGSSGFQPEFYKVMWKYIKHCFFRMCQESLCHQKLPQTLREGVLILIPKKGKPRDAITGYRPITLLNTGHKIISAAIAQRLGPEQTGFVPNRCIGSATRLTYDVIHNVNETGSGGLLVSLDMDNAFNAVEWSWIRASLVARGFPRVIVVWFNTLYNESFSRLTYLTLCWPYKQLARTIQNVERKNGYAVHARSNQVSFCRKKGNKTYLQPPIAVQRFSSQTLGNQVG